MATSIKEHIAKGTLAEAIRLDDLRIIAIEEENRKFVSNRKAFHYVITDTIGEGVKGVHNPVDGKRYDSKSAYHRKLKETGHHVFEGTPNPNKVLNKGDHNVFKELKEAAHKHGLY